MMRIVSFGDIHMSLWNIERLRDELQIADVVIISGDLTNFGGAGEARTVLDATQRHARRVLAVSGNIDQLDVIGFLHEQCSRIGRGRWLRWVRMPSHVSQLPPPTSPAAASSRSGFAPCRGWS